MLDKVRVDNIDDNVEKLLKARFIYDSDKNYPKDALQLHAENEPDAKKDEAVLNKVLVSFTQQTLTTKFQELANTHWQQFKLKIQSKVMLTVNLGMYDCLISSHAGNFVQGRVQKACVKTSDELAALTAMISSYLSRQNCWIPI